VGWGEPLELAVLEHGDVDLVGVGAGVGVRLRVGG
jgi:hypothetical protein